MPVVTMPNGDLVSFPDDVPADQIRSLILQKFPDAAKTAAQPALPAQAAAAAPTGGTLSNGLNWSVGQ